MSKGLANSSERKSESRAWLICDAAVANLPDETAKQQIQAVPLVPMFWLPTNYHRTNLCQHVWTVIQLWLLALFFFSFWKHTTHRIQKQSSQNRNGRMSNNTTSIQESYKDRWWWCSQVSVWTHKTHLSLSQKGGVYDSLQCLQPKTGSYFLKRRLLPQSSSEQLLSGQGRLAAPWSERSLTRRKVPLLLQSCATKLDHFVRCKQGYV